MELSHAEGEEDCFYFRQDGGLCTKSSSPDVRKNEFSPVEASTDTHGLIEDNGTLAECFNFNSDLTSSSSEGCNTYFDASLPLQESSSARTRRGIQNVAGTSLQVAPSNWTVEPDVIFDAQQGFRRYGCYTSVEITSGLKIQRNVSSSFNVNLLGSQLNILGWRHELSYENDYNLKQYLSFGVENGFYIVDPDAVITPYERTNYSSVLTGEAHTFIDSLIKTELAAGKYIIADKKPWCIHSLGAVPKKSGGWRPITDCKRPIGASINSFMTSTYKEFCYTTVDNVIDLIQPGWYMASVDISAIATKSADYFPHQPNRRGAFPHRPIKMQKETVKKDGGT